MSGIEIKYFKWLVQQCHLEEEVQKQHLGLFNQMHHKTFVWLVPNDNNRVDDGFALRTEFTKGRHHAFPFRVTVLEVLVALSRRVAFNSDGEPEWWAWKLVQNLGLDTVEGVVLEPEQEEEVDKILTRLVDRQYKPNGEGGFFPLPHTDEDQTKVEIWHQMNAYILTVVGI